MDRSENDGALRVWRDRYDRAVSQYSGELARMDHREKLYAGDQIRVPICRGDSGTDVPHLRNICCEMIENQVDTSIPMPKVTARRKEDEDKARLIENMLRNKIDLLPFERVNDLMSRLVPIQGGAAYHVEWDSSKRTHDTVGELCITAIHPKWIIPQDGVVTGIEDMDYIFLRLPSTKSAVERQYGVVLENVSEEEPEIRSAGDESAADGVVTVIIAYYRNSGGGIGKFAWCVDTVLEDLDDCQARRVRKCAVCGAPEGASEGSVNVLSDSLRSALSIEEEGTEDKGGAGEGRRGGVCPFCGSKKFTDGAQDYEEIYVPVMLAGGAMIPGEHVELSDTGEVDPLTGEAVYAEVMVPTKIPYYKPDRYPIILQKNVSQFGKFLGDSDIDKLESAQNTTNRLEKKIIDKLFAGGSFASLPPNCEITQDANDMKTLRLHDLSEKEYLGVYSLEANVAQDFSYLAQVYEEAMQITGVTRSFLGREDSTATSGVAKERSARQAAGRFESKGVMKRAALADVYELMFKFVLAYADEPFPVLSKDADGNVRYDDFNRYDFLKQDSAGEWYWNDAFLFDCDSSSSLAVSREAMWQELRQNLQTGAFGDPSSLDALILFWGLMEENHYPNAGQIKRKFEEKRDMELQAQQAAQMQQAQAAQYSGGVPGQAAAQGDGITPQGLI